ncbi:centrosomal protein poc5 [Plakobranchus ocellatus]|uniref:Centrosomal protein POC5 n=1 Tax=Plakobranchus ocellatus TaxID=259542 RepID=A0AAV3XQR4_9GAST|nr:centrosomal protein poc5 [Plakobranchus ocellatus]
MSDDGASADRSSPPILPPESPGSSVSTRMQEEYTELLKFALTSGVQDMQEEAETVGEHFNPVLSVSSNLMQEEEKNEDQSPAPPGASFSADTVENTNSNNIYHDSSNESPAPFVDPDTNTSYLGPSTSHVTFAPDLTEMGDKLDTLLGALKADILAELSKSMVKSLVSQKKNHEQEIKDLVSEKQRLEREATRLGEQVAAYEQSLARKETLVDNLTQALQVSKDQVKMAKIFYTTRAQVADQQRLNFAEKLAARHHEQQLVQRVMRAWFGQIQTRWRTRVQKACEEQARAVCGQLSQDYEEKIRKNFAEKLAARHHEQQLVQRVMRAWFGQIQTRWRTRVQRACEEQARAVCGQLSQDYEDKIKKLNTTIESLEERVSFMQQERGQYADQVRKAFMRGICALNMETMSAFGPEEDLNLDPATGHSQPKTVPTGPASYQDEDDQNYNHNANTNLSAHPVSAPESHLGDKLATIHHHQQQQQREPRSLPSVSDMQVTAGVIDSGTVGIQPRSLPTFAHKTKSKSTKSKSRPGTAPSSAPTRHSARPGGVTSQGQPLAPPMASVVVERHNAVTKQTLGKATAVRYPKHSSGSVSKSQPSSLLGQTFKPLAGQTGSMTIVSSIKVVD